MKSTDTPSHPLASQPKIPRIQTCVMTFMLTVSCDSMQNPRLMFCCGPLGDRYARGIKGFVHKPKSNEGDHSPLASAPPAVPTWGPTRRCWGPRAGGVLGVPFGVIGAPRGVSEGPPKARADLLGRRGALGGSSSPGREPGAPEPQGLGVNESERLSDASAGARALARGASSHGGAAKAARSSRRRSGPRRRPRCQIGPRGRRSTPG